MAKHIYESKESTATTDVWHGTRVSNFRLSDEQYKQLAKGETITVPWNSGHHILIRKKARRG